MEQKVNTDFAKKYPKTPRGVFKLFLFWLFVLCGATGVIFYLMHPNDPIAMKIVWPMIIASITSLILHTILNQLDKKI